MILRRSEFVHLLSVSDTAILAIHAVTQLRLPITTQVAQLIGAFSQPSELDSVVPRLAAAFMCDAASLRACALTLLERGILSDTTVEAERAAITAALSPAHGRDPAALLDRYRQANAEGSHPYWAVATPRAVADQSSLRCRVDILLFGDCDVQMETDFLRQEAARHGVDLRAAASFTSDFALAGERQHDAIIIGALQARHAIPTGADPAAAYVAAMRALLTSLRAITTAPILVDGLPEPTVQPRGLADCGIQSHRNRFRQTNLALAQLTAEFAGVLLVDVASALGAAGAERLLDDGLVAFTHFGSPGWMLQRPASEQAAVHGQVPDLAPLARSVGGDPYLREAVMARAHMDALTVMLALNQKKCVIVDLDGVLWPGVLAETGSPFAWAPDVSSPNSFVGLYFGIHEALLTLRQRGILLACVSKNDEATVRALWRYPDHYPHHRLLTLDSFVTVRINWDDKAANVASIAQELGFAMDAFVFVDDTARERERVQQTLPDVAVFGQDLYALRRIVLTDPRLQPAGCTAEAADRSALVKAQLDRARLQADWPEHAAFVESLGVVCTVDVLTPGTATAPVLDRISELFGRTTQFNATGQRFSPATLGQLVNGEGRVFKLRMQDRLADHGLVGAAVVLDGAILNVVLSCRVIGLGGETALLQALVADARGLGHALRGRIVETGRNIPVRHVYAGHGFTDVGAGWWRLPPAQTTPMHVHQPCALVVSPGVV